MASDPPHPPELSALLEISRKIATEPQSDELYQTILRYTVEVTDAEGGTIYFYDEDRRDLSFRFVISPDPQVALRLRGMRIKRGAGIVGQVAETLRTDLVADARHDPRFDADIDRQTGFETRSVLTVPLEFYDRDTQARTLVGVLQLVNKRHGCFDEGDVRKLEAFGGFAASLLTRAKLFERLRRHYLGTITSLAEAVDAKDPYTHGHAVRVAAYALELAQTLGLSPAQRFDLRISALLHDIGKIGIPDAILRKQDRLDEEEYARMKSHAAEGMRILRPVQLSGDIYDGILFHHEKWDGSGYPQQRRGAEIPPFARILALADAFDAITTDRPYRRGRTFGEARQMILEAAGTHFDPVLAPKFCALALEESATPLPVESDDPRRDA